MLVVIANDLPPAVRGRMKLWFVEAKPNVFVSGIKDSLSSTVVEYLHGHCPPESGVVIFRSTTSPPGYVISAIGPTTKQQISISGLQLVIESQRMT